MPKISGATATAQETVIQEQSHQDIINMPSMHLPHSLDDVNRGSLSAAQSEYFTQLAQANDLNLNVSTGQTTFLSVMNSQVLINTFKYIARYPAIMVINLHFTFGSLKGRRSIVLEYHRLLKYHRLL